MARQQNDIAEKGQATFEGELMGSERNAPNKSLQVTFDPPPIFAAAKTGVASNAGELRRCASFNFNRGQQHGV